MNEWDVGLGRLTREGGPIQVTLPSVVSRALVAKGYNRAVLTLTDDGLLLKPYVSDVQPKRRGIATVQLPEWT